MIGIFKLPLKYYEWIFKALDVFFESREYKLPRFQITYHPQAQHYLICLCDAEEYFYSHVIILVTQLGHEGDPDFTSKVIPLINKSWVTPQTFSIL